MKRQMLPRSFSQALAACRTGCVYFWIRPRGEVRLWMAVSWPSRCGSRQAHRGGRSKGPIQFCTCEIWRSIGVLLRGAELKRNGHHDEHEPLFLLSFISPFVFVVRRRGRGLLLRSRTPISPGFIRCFLSCTLLHALSPPNSTSTPCLQHNLRPTGPRAQRRPRVPPLTLRGLR